MSRDNVLRELWDRYAVLGYERVYEVRLIQDHLQQLTSLFLPSSGICLDAGCGTGQLFDPIVKKIQSRVIYGTDWSEEMLKKAEAETERLKQSGAQFEIQCNDLSKSPWSHPDRHFDAVVSNLLIGYLSCGWRVPLKEMKRVLKSGGYLYLGTLLEGWGFTQTMLEHAAVEFLKSPLFSLKELTLLLKYQRIITRIYWEAKEQGAGFPVFSELIGFLNDEFEQIATIPTYWKRGVALRARRK